MSYPSNPAKPQLKSRCYEHDVPVGSSFESFKQEVMNWIATCVTSRTINPETGKPWRREIELVEHPANLKDLQAIYDNAKNAPTPMSLNKSSRTVKVKAHYFMGRLSNGQWWVRQVAFSSQGQIYKAPPEPPDATFKIRDVVFPIDGDDINSFASDVMSGDKFVKKELDAIYQEAKKEAKLPDNPVSTPSGKSIGKSFVKVVKGGALPHKKLAEMVLGSWLQSVINGQAGDVARVRRRAYSFFAAGFVSAIIVEETAKPTDDFDKKYYELGRQAASKYTAEQQYQIQLALLHYWQQNPTSGWKIPRPQNWVFPDDYQRYWGPSVLAEALYNHLYKTKYSVD